MMRKMLVNSFGLTIITTMEEEHLMAKYTFDKISLAISGFYELDHEENLLLLLQHKVPNGNITADFLQRMKLRGMGMVLKMADKDTITITDQFLTEEKKTMIYKLDESVEYKITGI